MKVDPNKVFTATEASKLLGKNLRTILRSIDSGKLHATKTGKGYVISGVALNDYLGVKNYDIASLRLESALVALDLGYTPLPSELINSDFYNVSSGVVTRIAKEAPNRADMLTQIAEFINQTRTAKLKPNVVVRAKDIATGKLHAIHMISHDQDGHITNLMVWNDDGSITDVTDDPNIVIKPVLVHE